MQHAQRSFKTDTAKRSIHDWLAEYGESHQHPTNKLIHWFAVPGIFWSIVALLWVIPTVPKNVEKHSTCSKEG